MNALAAVILVLVVLRLTGRTKRFLGSVWVPVGTGALGIAAVGLPVVARLRAQLAAGPIEAANALLLFSMEVDADRGATLALAGASLYLANESEATACAIIADLRAERGLTERVDDALSAGAMINWRTYCATNG